MTWIVSREFDIDMEFGIISCIAEMDISGDFVVVKKVIFEDSKGVLKDVEEYIKEFLEDSESPADLRYEEKSFDEANRAEEDREQDLIGDDEC